MKENIDVISKEQSIETSENDKKLRKEKKKEEINLERYGIKIDEKNNAKKVNWKALFKCFKYFSQYKWLILLIILCAIGYVLLYISSPFFTESLLSCIGEQNLEPAIWLAVIMYAVYAGLEIIGYAWDCVSVRLSNEVTKSIRLDLINSTFNTKTKKFDEINTGELVTKINKDSTAMSNIVNFVVERCSDIFGSIAIIAYFFVLNLYLGLTVLGIVIIFTIVDNINQRFKLEMNRKETILKDRNIGIVSEIIRSIRDIKALNIKKNVNKVYQQNINYLTNVSNDRTRVGFLFLRGGRVLLDIAELCLVVLGMYLTATSIITLSVFIIFIMYYGRALNVLKSINEIREKLRVTAVSAERICEILDDNNYPKEKFGRKKIRRPKGKIEFKNVDFSYDEKNKVFENLNLTIPANKTVALVGQSGNGKTSLINLIAKLYEINGGQILIDGEDITTLSEKCLRNLVTMVPQSPYIFNMTIRENLALVKPNMTDEEMIDACQKAQIHDFIMSKEHGYDSIVGENGVALSGGQKQRLAIARALLKNSKIILLDEATSALDNISQEKIIKALDRIKGSHTIVIVAHRLSVISKAEKIFVIDKGKIAGEGKHEDLLTSCDIYKKLYNNEMANLLTDSVINEIVSNNTENVSNSAVQNNIANGVTVDGENAVYTTKVTSEDVVDANNSVRGEEKDEQENNLENNKVKKVSQNTFIIKLKKLGKAKRKITTVKDETSYVLTEDEANKINQILSTETEDESE